MSACTCTLHTYVQMWKISRHLDCWSLLLGDCWFLESIFCFLSPIRLYANLLHSKLYNLKNSLHSICVPDSISPHPFWISQWWWLEQGKAIITFCSEFQIGLSIVACMRRRNFKLLEWRVWTQHCWKWNCQNEFSFVLQEQVLIDWLTQNWIHTPVSIQYLCCHCTNACHNCYLNLHRPEYNSCASSASCPDCNDAVVNFAEYASQNVCQLLKFGRGIEITTLEKWVRLI